MDRQELKDYMLKYYGLRTNQVQRSWPKKIAYLYGLRPSIKDNFRSVDVIEMRWIKGRLNGSILLRENRMRRVKAKTTLRGTKERYRSFSDLIVEKEKRYLELKENHTSDLQNTRAMERRLLEEDPAVVEEIKKEIEDQFTASAIQVGKTLSVHVFKTMEMTKLKARWNDTEAAQKHSPLRLSYGFDSQQGYLDHLIRMFREELTLLNMLFDKEWDVTFLKRTADPLLRRQHLKMESEDAQSMVKELKTLHKKTERMLSQLEKDLA